MKILAVINNLSIGGAERLVVDQTNYLEKNGHEIHVLTLLSRNKPGFYGNLEFSKGKLLNISTDSFVKSLFSIRKIILEGHYDVIISHLFLANTLVRLVKILIFSRVKVIVYEHNTYQKEKRFRHLLIDLVLSSVTYKIIAVSDLVKTYLVSKRISENKIVVIKNGVSADFVEKIVSPQEMRRKLGFNEKDILVVSSGNVNSQKGYETLIEAAQIVVKKYPSTLFLICGSDVSPYATSLKNGLLDKQLSKNFHFLGPRLDATNIVNCADIFVMTSLWEGLSMSLLEALLLGKLIIVSRIPSLTALIQDGYNGLTFEVSNNKQLAELIMSVVSNISKYQIHKENAKIIGSRYSIGSNVEQLLSLLTTKK